MSIDPVAEPPLGRAGTRAAPSADQARGGRSAAVFSLLFLVAVLVVRFYATLTSSVARVDEAAYLAAFEATHRGASPYTVPGYLYTPSFAVLGGLALHGLSAATIMSVLRATNVIGTAAIVALSASLLPWSRLWRLAASALFLVAAPAVALAVRTGNDSPTAAALLVAGLLAWPRRPVLAGFTLGASLAWKPLGALALPVLAAHRPDQDGRRHLLAAVVGAATAAAVSCFGARYLGEFLTLGATIGAEDFRVSRTVSLQRLLSSLGLPVDRLVVSLIVAAAAVLIARSRRWSASDLLCLALAATCLSLPALWPHTFLMTLPIQALALRRAFDRNGARGEEGWAGRVRWYELAGVLGGMAALQWSDGVGGLDPSPSLALAAAMLPSVLAPSLLALYVMAPAKPPRVDC